MPKGVYLHRGGKRVADVVFKCEVCESPIAVLPSQARQRKIRFCSKKCEGKSAYKPSSHVELNCSFCTKLIVKDKHRVKKNNFCSEKCRDDFRKVPGAKWRDPNQIKQYMKEYFYKNRQKHIEQSRKWAQNNIDKRLVISQKYRVNHRDRIVIAESKRKQAVVEGDLTTEQWIGIKSVHNQKCAICKKETKLTLDHIIPLSKGGKHTASNIQPLCKSCNSRKGNKLNYQITEIT